MNARLIDFLLARSPRERWLLGVLVLGVLPLALVFAVLLPLRAAQQDALDARTEAVAMNLWVQDRALEMAQLGAAPQASPQSAIGMSGIEETLIDAGLRDAVTDLVQDSRGQVALRFDQVRFTRLMGWLSGVAPTWGYDVNVFRIEAGPVSGDVEASLTLVPQTAP